MVLGLPRVSFDVGGCADIMGGLRARYVAPDGDLDRMAALAAAVVRRLPDGALQPELTERAAAFDTAPVVRSARFHAVLSPPPRPHCRSLVVAVAVATAVPREEVMFCSNPLFDRSHFVGARLDDIELAAGGTAARLVLAGVQVRFLAMSTSEYTCYDGTHSRGRDG